VKSHEKQYKLRSNHEKQDKYMFK